MRQVFVNYRQKESDPAVETEEKFRMIHKINHIHGSTNGHQLSYGKFKLTTATSGVYYVGKKCRISDQIKSK